MIRKEIATANSKSRTQVDTVKGAGVGFASLGSALSMFVGSTEGKGKFNLNFILSEINQGKDFGRSASISFDARGHSAGFGEML
jgi:hypothetical protein